MTVEAVVVLKIGSKQDGPKSSTGFTTRKRCVDGLRVGVQEITQGGKHIIAANPIESRRVPLESFQNETGLQGMRAEGNAQIVTGLEGIHEEETRVVDGGA